MANEQFYYLVRCETVRNRYTVAIKIPVTVFSHYTLCKTVETDTQFNTKCIRTQ